MVPRKLFLKWRKKQTRSNSSGEPTQHLVPPWRGHREGMVKNVALETDSLEVNPDYQQRGHGQVT